MKTCPLVSATATTVLTYLLAGIDAYAGGATELAVFVRFLYMYNEKNCWHLCKQNSKRGNAHPQKQKCIIWNKNFALAYTDCTYTVQTCTWCYLVTFGGTHSGCTDTQVQRNFFLTRKKLMGMEETLKHHAKITFSCRCLDSAAPIMLGAEFYPEKLLFV